MDGLRPAERSKQVRMKICINALGLKPSATGGLEVYLLNLIKSLGDFDRENEYHVFLNNRNMRKKVEPFTNTNIKIRYFSQLYTSMAAIFLLVIKRPKILYRLLVKELGRIFFSKNIWEVDTTGIYGKIIDLDSFGMDVIHFPLAFIDPSFYRIGSPTVFTVHDLQHEYYPEFFDKDTLALRRKLYRDSAENADVLIAISEACRNSIIEKYGIQPEKIMVTYQCSSKKFKKIDNDILLRDVRKRYALPDEFLFYPAGTWFHKNHVKLLEALAILKTKHAAIIRLVMTGFAQNNYRNVMDIIHRLHLGEQVSFLNYVPFDHLPAIYNLAKVMVFPSLFEGFGLPLLEAMNVGLPIACSDRTSIPEIVGDAGVYFDADNADDIAEKIYYLWQSENVREELVSKGHKQAKRFSSKKTAINTIAAYKLASQKKRHPEISV